MAKREVYHVEPARGDARGWDVKKTKGPVVSHHDRKTEAVAKATKLAKGHELGQVKIHDASGRFQEERTYGKDPRRTPG